MATYEYVKGATDASLAATYGGVLPTAGDTVNFSAGSGNFNVNPDGLTAVGSLAAVNFRPGCSINVGDSGAPFEIDVSGTLNIGWSGQVAYISAGAGGTIDTIIVQPTGPATIYLSDLANNTLKVLFGTVILGSGVTLAAIEVIGSGSQLFIPEHGSDVTTTIRVTDGGRVVCRRRIAGTVTLSKGGSLEYDVDTTTTTSQAFNIDGGSLVLKKGSAVVNLYSGEFDYSKIEKSTYTLTIADSGGTEKVGPVTPTFSRTTTGRGSRKIPA